MGPGPNAWGRRTGRRYHGGVNPTSPEAPPKTAHPDPSPTPPELPTPPSRSAAGTPTISLAWKLLLVLVSGQGVAALWWVIWADANLLPAAVIVLAGMILGVSLSGIARLARADRRTWRRLVLASLMVTLGSSGLLWVDVLASTREVHTVEVRGLTYRRSGEVRGLELRDSCLETTFKLRCGVDARCSVAQRDALSTPGTAVEVVVDRAPLGTHRVIELRGPSTGAGIDCRGP